MCELLDLIKGMSLEELAKLLKDAYGFISSLRIDGVHSEIHAQAKNNVMQVNNALVAFSERAKKIEETYKKEEALKVANGACKDANNQATA